MQDLPQNGDAQDPCNVQGHSRGTVERPTHTLCGYSAGPGDRFGFFLRGRSLHAHRASGPHLRAAPRNKHELVGSTTRSARPSPFKIREPYSIQSARTLRPEFVMHHIQFPCTRRPKFVHHGRNRTRLCGALEPVRIAYALGCPALLDPNVLSTMHTHSLSRSGRQTMHTF
jgi:hypothetical protein